MSEERGGTFGELETKGKSINYNLNFNPFHKKAKKYKKMKAIKEVQRQKPSPKGRAKAAGYDPYRDRGANMSPLVYENHREKYHKNGFIYYETLKTYGNDYQSHGNLYYKSKRGKVKSLFKF